MKFTHKIMLAVALAVGLILFAAGTGIISAVLGGVATSITGIEEGYGWFALFLVIVLWRFVPDRFKVLHRSYEIRGTALIDAPVAEVWDTVLPQPGKAYFSESFTHVAAVPGEPDRIDFHTENEGFNGPLPPLQAVLQVVEPQTYFYMSYLNVDAYPLWAGDLVSSEYFVETEDGMTRLTMIETLDKLRISTVLSLFLLNPCRDSAKRIKALCEGTPDPSWMTWMNENTQKDSGGMGGGTVMTVGILTCVFVTLLTFGLLYALMAVLL